MAPIKKETIFVSYIHEDEIVAKALARFLEAKTKVSVFVASDELRLGDEWLSRIREALKSAKVVLALFSPSAIKRPWVNFEAGGAWFTDDKKLIPICIGGLDPSRLPKPYSNIQGAKLSSEVPGDVWGIVQDLWKVLDLKGTAPPPFAKDDNDVGDLFSALARWKVAERAAKTYKRLYKQEPPSD